MKGTEVLDQTKERSVEVLFPLPLHFAVHKDADQLNRKITKASYALKEKTPNTLPPGSSNDHYSTLWSGIGLLDQPGFEELRHFIAFEANVFANLLNFDIQNYPLKLTDSWLNIHGPGNSQEPHVHQNNFISGVYYVKKPKDSGDLIIHSPYKYQMLQAPITKVNQYTVRTIPITSEAGVLVLFQSFTEHSVQANKSNDDRISISFNFTM